MKTNQHFKLIALAIGFIICGLAATAQTNWDTLPFKDYADYKLQNLNKAYISTGILYDRVFPIAQLDNHIASASSTDTATPAHLAQAYFEMYNASYNTTGWLTPTQIDDQIKAKGNNRQHPIGIFLYNYNVIDSNALADNLLDTMADGRFYDVANRSRSPYFSYTSFMASPLKAEDQVLEQGLHTFLAVVGNSLRRCCAFGQQHN